MSHRGPPIRLSTTLLDPHNCSHVAHQGNAVWFYAETTLGGRSGQHLFISLDMGRQVFSTLR